MARMILIVEDEVSIATAVADRLISEGFDTDIVGDGLEAVQRCADLEPALVVLDLMLPGLDGIEVCRRIQADRRVPVLMLTARSDETDRVIGLGVGADDYLTKPFSPRELVARVHAILRRVETPTAAGGTPAIEVGDLTIHLEQRRVVVSSRDVHLTATEFDLLVCLATALGRVFTREQLLYDVWGYRDATGARTVDSHIRALRRKLGDGYIRTVHGVGYSVEAPQ